MASADEAGNALQRRYDRLAAMIEKAQARLAGWREHGPRFAHERARRTDPLAAELAGRRVRIVARLDEWLVHPGTAAADGHRLREVLCEMAADLIESDDLGADGRAEMKRLHDRHAAQAGSPGGGGRLHTLRTVFASLRHPQEMPAGAAGNEPANDAASPASCVRPAPCAGGRSTRPRSTPRRAPSVRAASQQVREVYRRLASAVHPDRAADPRDRATRTALMQRLNRAYETRDVLGLVRLE